MNGLSNLEQHLQRLVAEQRWDEAQHRIDSHRAQFGNSAELEYFVAGIYGAKRDFGAAEQHCRNAIVLNAGYGDAWFRLGNALDAQQRRTDALPCFDRALQLAPHHAHAWNNRGACYLALQQYSYAERDFEHALDLEPDLTAFQTNLLLTRIYLGRTDEVLRDLESVIAPLDQSSDRSYIFTLLGIAFLKAGSATHAEILVRRVLEWMPHGASGHVNLGLALLAQARWLDAQQAFESARTLEPNNVEAAWSLGCLSLLLGDYPRGWPLYEYRWLRKRHARGYGFPEWDGVTSLAGKTLLLYCEQGYGDSIQFARFIPQLKACGARLLFTCPAALTRLLAIFEVEQVNPPSPVGVSFQCALGSLPYHLQISKDQLALPQAYLSVPETAKRRWTQHFQDLDSTKRNIGFVWSGNPKHVNDANRSVPLHHFTAAFKLPGIRWFSLQRGPTAASAREFLAQAGVQTLGDACADFADTAAVIAELDLVISVDTSVAHLTGALGRPGWILLPYVPDWRWGLEPEHSPWYPQLRLFRQSQPGNWNEVMERVVAALNSLG